MPASLLVFIAATLLSFSIQASHSLESKYPENVVLFQTNSAEIDEKYHELLSHHASVLIASPESIGVIVAHADERGNLGYNKQLAQRRANAVDKHLEKLGVEPMQLITASYGEIKPTAHAKDADAMQVNRRAFIIYQTTKD